MISEINDGVRWRNTRNPFSHQIYPYRVVSPMGAHRTFRREENAVAATPQDSGAHDVIVARAQAIHRSKIGMSTPEAFEHTSVTSSWIELRIESLVSSLQLVDGRTPEVMHRHPERLQELGQINVLVAI